MTDDHLIEFIELLADAPESQMDAPLAQRCASFDATADDPVYFLRDLRDLCVFTGSSGFMVRAISAVLAPYDPEPADEQTARRKTLEAER